MYTKPKLTILIFTLILVVGGIFVVQQNEDITSLPTEIETVDTSDWVTYRNEELGFEVKHPEGWRIYVPTKTRTDLDRVLFGPSDMSEDDMWWRIDRYELDDENYDFSVFKNNIKKRYTLVPVETDLTLKIVETSFEGFDAFIQILGGDNPDSVGEIEAHKMFVNRGKYVWSFPVDRVNADYVQDPNYNIQIYQGLIKTFKFLD